MRSKTPFCNQLVACTVFPFKETLARLVEPSRATGQHFSSSQTCLDAHCIDSLCTSGSQMPHSGCAVPGDLPLANIWAPSCGGACWEATQPCRIGR